MSKFSDLVRRLRHNRSLTQQIVAKRCRDYGYEVSPSMISLIESGKRSPKTRNDVIALASALESSEGDRSALLLEAGYEVVQSGQKTTAKVNPLPRLAAYLNDF